MQKLFLALLACSSVAFFQKQTQKRTPSYERPAPSSVLFNARIKTPEPRLEPALEGRIMGDAAQMKDAQGRALCPPRDTRVRGRATGSFTRAGASQSAYLVFGCRVTLETESYGLLIYEGSRLLSSTHLTLTDVFGFAREFYAARDLNRNGLSELALRWSTADGCCTLERLSLFEFREIGLSALGELPVLLEGAENNPGGGFTNFNYTLYVQKGPRPVFIGVDALNKKFPTVLELEKAQFELKNFQAPTLPSAPTRLAASSSTRSVSSQPIQASVTLTPY